MLVGKTSYAERTVNKPRPFRPSAEDVRNRKHQSDSSTKVHFDADAWNAWHYGDNAIQTSSVKRKTWMNMPNSRDQSYFVRKTERENEARKAKMDEEEAKTALSAADVLRFKREERRRQTETADLNKEGDKSCAVS